MLNRLAAAAAASVLAVALVPTVGASPAQAAPASTTAAAVQTKKSPRLTRCPAQNRKGNTFTECRASIVANGKQDVFRLFCEQARLGYIDALRKHRKAYESYKVNKCKRVLAPKLVNNAYPKRTSRTQLVPSWGYVATLKVKR